jgi:molybdenum cofactor cytidylyltransferase
VVVPTAAGRPGNPVLWPASLFPALARLVGDTGGRALLAAGHCRDEAGMPVPVVQVAMADDAVLVDVDDADALARLEAAARAGR